MPNPPAIKPFRVRKSGTREITLMELSTGMQGGTVCVVCGKRFRRKRDSEVYGTFATGKSTRQEVRSCTAHGDDRLF